MDNNQLELELFTNYFKQTKQRVDIDIEMTHPKVTAMTKLTFLQKEGKTIPQIKEMKLCLNAENIYISKITFLKNYFSNNNNSTINNVQN